MIFEILECDGAPRSSMTEVESVRPIIRNAHYFHSTLDGIMAELLQIECIRGLGIPKFTNEIDPQECRACDRRYSCLSKLHSIPKPNNSGSVACRFMRNVATFCSIAEADKKGHVRFCSAPGKAYTTRDS